MKKGQRNMKRSVVKGSVSNSVKWKPEYRQKLNELIARVHNITTHAYLFSKYIFITELQKDNTFNLKRHVQARFFEEAFLSLTTRKQQITDKTSEEIKEWTNLIRKHLQSYMSTSGYTKVNLPNGQQIAKYEATKIATAYLNNVQERLGAQFRSLVNCLLDTKGRTEHLNQNLQKQGKDKATIKEEVKIQITKPAALLKQQLARGRDGQIERHESDSIKDIFDAVWDMYPENYKFLKGSIYYDVKAYPDQHLQAFFMITAIQQTLGYPCSQVFPIRTSLIPCYMQIDTKILGQHILDGKDYAQLRKSTDDQLDKKMKYVWGKVVDLSQPIFKKQKDLQFQGTIFTDGIGISILKQDGASKFGGGKRKRKFKDEEDEARSAKYIHQQAQSFIKANMHRFVYADPNRRDLLYCQKDGSTADNPKTYRFTRNQLQVEMKRNKYKLIRRETMSLYSEKYFDNEHQLASLQSRLNQLNRKSVYPTDYQEYLAGRHTSISMLSDCYHHPIFRKLKLNTFMLQQRSNARLVNSLRKNFGKKCVIILGDWSGGHSKFHEPVRSKGLYTMLTKHGMEVYYIDEYNTSKVCPGPCGGSPVVSFLKVPNPRSWQRHQRPFVTCHGLLKCGSSACQIKLKQNGPHGGTVQRLWNRDIVATSNFKRIAHHLVRHNTIHPLFQRPTSDLDKQSQQANRKKSKI